MTSLSECEGLVISSQVCVGGRSKNRHNTGKDVTPIFLSILTVAYKGKTGSHVARLAQYLGLPFGHLTYIDHKPCKL